MQRASILSALRASAPILLGVSSATSVAAAQPAPAPSSTAAPQAGLDPNSGPVHLVDDSDPLPPLVPRAKDLLGGHVLLAASIGPTWSVGRLSSSSVAKDYLGTGLGVQADAGIGVSRTVSLGIWGSFARYADGNECSSCSGQALALGPFVRYQLSQGLRFVPWVLAGTGYRNLSFDEGGVKQTFAGVTWGQLELGGDYYVLSGFGFGPYAGLALSSYFQRPDGSGSLRVNTELNFGLRLLLDAPGR